VVANTGLVLGIVLASGLALTLVNSILALTSEALFG
jgi:hypothetical protein